MVVRVLIFGGFVPCSDTRLLCRGAFVPAPEITVHASNVIENDIAVTETSTENVTTLDAFRTAQDSLWPLTGLCITGSLQMSGLVL